MRDRPDFYDWLEAWLSGYNAARAGQPNDESIIAAARAAFENGGTERARRLVAVLAPNQDAEDEEPRLAPPSVAGEESRP